MKRKLLIIILAVSTLLCCIFGFSACKGDPKDKASKGLEFTLLPDKKSYALTGTGTCTDSKIVVPSKYKGKRVTRIGLYTKLEELGAEWGLEDIDEDNFDEADLEALLGELLEKASDLFIFAESPVKEVVLNKNIKEIGVAAFAGCVQLSSLDIPDSVTYIAPEAFMACVSLNGIIIPDSVTDIGLGAFMACASLQYARLPSNLKTIDKLCFSYCTSFTSFNIPEGTTLIDDYAFAGCIALYTVNLPSAISDIGDGAFYACVGLNKLNYPDTVEKWHSAVKNELWDFGADDYTLTCTDGTLYGRNGGTSKGLEFSLLEDGTFAISGIGSCTDTDIKIPSWYLSIPVTKIGSRAFFCCDSIKSVTIPESITEIYSYAFSYCGALTQIIIPKNVTCIGTAAFRYCDNLKSVILPDGAKKIDSFAFDECRALESVTIPDSVTEIYGGAFYGCSSLKAINYGGTVEEWNALFKGDDWDKNTGEYTVHCKDGTIKKV